MSELWDVYDRERDKTGRLIERGQPMVDGDYHIVVQVWIRNRRGEWLISRRTPNKTHPLMWETTGGSVIAGENSLTAAIREVHEELGITLDPDGGHLLGSERYDKPDWTNPGFVDIWLFEHDCPIEAAVFQEGETCGAMWADVQKICGMIKGGEFVSVSNLIPPLDIYSTQV